MSKTVPFQFSLALVHSLVLFDTLIGLFLLLLLRARMDLEAMAITVIPFLFGPQFLIE